MPSVDHRRATTLSGLPVCPLEFIQQSPPVPAILIAIESVESRIVGAAEIAIGVGGVTPNGRALSAGFRLGALELWCSSNIK